MTSDTAPISSNTDDDAFKFDFWKWVYRVAFVPVDAMPLVIFRVAYGITMLYWAQYYMRTGLLEQYYILPRYHFKWDYFEWVTIMSPLGMRIHFIAIAVLGALVTIGFLYRFTSVLLGLAFAYVFLLEKAYYQNHYYLLTVVGLLMPLVPCHRIWSVDASLWPRIRSQVVPFWTIFFVRFLVGVPYFYGGIAKITPDWLEGQPVRMMLTGQGDHPFVGLWAGQEWLVWFFVWGGILFDLLVVPALLWKRTRLLALAAATMFHLSNATMFSIGVFPWFMIAATLVYLPSGTFRKLMGRPKADFSNYRIPRPAIQTVTIGLLMAFVTFNLIFPFRNNVMRGNVNWTEHGHHFSWRMKLRGKRSAINIIAYDPVTGARQTIDMHRWLTDFQGNRMARDPKMVHDFSRFIKQQFTEQGYPMTKVHALVLVSLNGRKPQLLIDPKVDLGSMPKQYGPPTYVLPLTEPLRKEYWDEPREQWARHLPAEIRRQPQIAPEEISLNP